MKLLKTISQSLEQLFAPAIVLMNKQVTATMEDSVQISRKASSYAGNVKSSLDKQASLTMEVAASSEALNRLSNELLLSLQRFRIE